MDVDSEYAMAVRTGRKWKYFYLHPEITDTRRDPYWPSNSFSIPSLLEATKKCHKEKSVLCTEFPCDVGRN
jgi:hypothetical protein